MQVKEATAANTMRELGTTAHYGTRLDRLERMSTLIQDTLKKEYWRLLKKENYPKTPNITEQLNELEREIGKFAGPKRGSRKQESPTASNPADSDGECCVGA
jgi:hypothetical protein